MKSMVRILGFCITGFAFLYLIRTCFQLDFQTIHFTTPRLYYGCLGIFIFIYGLFFILLAWGWFLILRALSDQAKGVSFRDVLSVYFRTNILKYLPGNFMEFIGRNYLANRYGISHGDIALSSILETVFLILSSLFVAAVFSFSLLKSFLFRWVSSNGPRFLLVVIGVLLVVALLIILVDWMRAGSWGRFFSLAFMKLSMTLAFFNVVVIVWLGLLLAGILMFILGVQIGLSQVLLVIGAMSLSWTCGFVTPGAPGGLGVREAVLFMLLSTTIARESLMIAMALHRLVSILGDGVVFGASCFLPLKGLDEARLDKGF